MSSRNDAQDITFVVQGAVTEIESTKLCLLSIRKHFPGAEIILSTWNSTHLSISDEFDYDRLVLSDDPGGGYVDKEKKMLFNLNRQIISSSNGVKKARTKYVVKTRTDNFFLNDNLLRYVKNISNPIDDYTKLLVISDWFINPSSAYKMPMHCSDFIVFGIRENVCAYFDCPLMPNYYYNWFDLSERKRSAHKDLEKFLFKYSAEQYLFINYLKTKSLDFNIKIPDHAFDCSDEIIKSSEYAISKLLFVLPSKKIGMHNIKHKFMYLNSWPCYTESELNKIANGFSPGFSFFNSERMYKIFIRKIFSSFYFIVRCGRNE